MLYHTSRNIFGEILVVIVKQTMISLGQQLIGYRGFHDLNRDFEFSTNSLTLTYYDIPACVILHMITTSNNIQRKMFLFPIILCTNLDQIELYPQQHLGMNTAAAKMVEL